MLTATSGITFVVRGGYICQLLRIENVTWSAQRFPTAANLGFLDGIRYFLEIAPELSSRG
jgi:hypothetical protein